MKRSEWWDGAFAKGFLVKEALIRVGLVILILTVVSLVPVTKKFVQPEDWWRYRFPYSHRETFSATVAALFLIVCPLINLPYVVWITRKKRNRRQLYRDAIYFLLIFSLSLLTSILTCELTKRLVGRLRPDFLSRCFGVSDPAALVKLSASFTEPTIPKCTNTQLSAHRIADGFMSFPSEHSATAFSTFSAMAIWNFTQIRFIEGYGAEALVLPLVMMILPLVVALSRITDYRHHASDIATGIAIGFGTTLLSFYFYYPRRGSKQPGRMPTLVGEDLAIVNAHDDDPEEPPFMSSSSPPPNHHESAFDGDKTYGTADV